MSVNRRCSLSIQLLKWPFRFEMSCERFIQGWTLTVQSFVRNESNPLRLYLKTSLARRKINACASSVTIFYMFNLGRYTNIGCTVGKFGLCVAEKLLLTVYPMVIRTFWMQISHSHHNIHHQHHHRIKCRDTENPTLPFSWSVKCISGWAFSVFLSSFKRMRSARLFVDALRSPAGKGLTSWLSFVMSNCDVVTLPLVSWVRCGA